MTLLEARRTQARYFAALARRARYMQQNERLAKTYAVKAWAALAMMELEISPTSPYVGWKHKNSR